jgi:hypothetical protein
MSIEPIGLITVILGLLCLQFGYLATATTFMILTLLGSAAAMLIGGANIQPAHLFLAFVAASTLLRSREKAAAMDALTFPKPGFWLMCLVIFGVFTAFAMPRLLAGVTPMLPLGYSEYADTGSTVPLGPVSSNFTQSVYFTADLVCFTLIAAIAATRTGFEAMAGALVLCAAGNALFALLDLGTYYTGTSWLLGFIRNAQYTLHTNSEVAGLKRIVGSFPEASSFGRETLGLLAFTGTLWACGRRPGLTGALALISLALVVFSTSSAGLAGTAPVVLILYATAIMRRGFHASRPLASATILCAPLLVVALILTAQLGDETFAPIRNYINDLVFNKGTTESGIERASYNNYAMQNFFDTFGLGVGLGTVRTSSFAVALLAGVGVPGTIIYLLFAVTAFARRRGIPRTFPSDVRLAARNACLGFMVGDMVGSTSIEQGLAFYVFAAMACAVPERDTVRVASQLSVRSGSIA